MRSRILEAAKTLFVAEGYPSVSIRRIAEAIEYSPSTIYGYFKDKDDILFALHNVAFQDLFRRQLPNAQITSPVDRLLAFLSTYLEFALDNREYYDLMFIQYAPVSRIKEKAEWRYGRRSFDMLRDTVRACQDSGYLRGTDPDAAALGLWSFVHGVASLIIRHRIPMLPPERREDLARQAMEMLTGMVGATRHRVVQ
ncbi:TetR/AcrR family transcriptional regulator [bacterium]|nr:TetR/AcrR family transcriptional regulator [bacterium]MBU1985341.1 TetR/AcrR family transcriptional regulator [bacterium]